LHMTGTMGRLGLTQKGMARRYYPIDTPAQVGGEFQRKGPSVSD
jgi:hypothetical protein